MYRLYLIKRTIEDIIMFPFILLGRFIGALRPLDKEYETFFFFPFYHVGGAEKVHAQVAKATGNKNCIIFFTRKSQNDLFYNEFAASGCTLKDISKYTDNKWIYFVNILFRGIISYYINRQQQRPVVFNGQCNFGYKISPWISKSIPQIELIHSLCSFSYIRIPFLPFIDTTVMISTIRIEEHLDLYKRYQIPLEFGKRIQFIMNGIDLPEQRLVRDMSTSPLKVLYVGRSTAEKRVHLIAQMAKAISDTSSAIQFQFMGEVKEAIPSALHPYCQFLGNQSDPAVIASFYQQAHILILTSDTEGFPMVVMEAMAFGLAVVTTAVGEIPLHVKTEENGYLIEDYNNTEAVVSQSVDYITQLNNDRHLLQRISANNIAYAYTQFGINRFAAAYQHLFEKARTSTLAS
jgi:glycosyltransferase involved in cell wall biosynthesis